MWHLTVEAAGGKFVSRGKEMAFIAMVMVESITSKEESRVSRAVAGASTKKGQRG
jgi:hypothetical protein